MRTQVSISRAALAALVLSTSACSVPRVENTQASIEVLASAVIEAVERRDVDRLHDLALNEQEFREVVWPDLPAARPERNMPVDYVWSDLHMKSATSLERTLNRYAETPMTLVEVRFDGETSHYGRYVVRRETVVVVKAADGRQHDVRLFGSVFEQDGRYKVFSYNVD